MFLSCSFRELPKSLPVSKIFHKAKLESYVVGKKERKKENSASCPSFADTLQEQECSTKINLLLLLLFSKYQDYNALNSVLFSRYISYTFSPLHFLLLLSYAAARRRLETAQN
jgi:hypothetical protein